MTEQEFKKYLGKVNELIADERRMLVDHLSHVDHQHEVFDLIDSHFKEQGCCPHCARHDVLVCGSPEKGGPAHPQACVGYVGMSESSIHRATLRRAGHERG